MSVVWLLLSVQLTILNLVSAPIIRATLQHRHVHTAGVEAGLSKCVTTFGGGNLRLLRAEVIGGRDVVPLRYSLAINGRENALLRWQLVGGKFHCIKYSWASSEVVSRNGALSSVALDAIETANARVKDERRARQQYETFQASITSGPDLGALLYSRSFGENIAVKRHMYLDFWCREDRRYEVYVVEPHENACLIRHDFRPDGSIRSDQSRTLQWNKVGEWKAEWKGPFYVTATGDRRFIVTDTGRLYAVPGAAKGRAPLELIWKGTPIDVLIHDADGEKWYAFTKSEFFEISDSIEPQAHDLSIRRSGFANEALLTAARCASVIRTRLAPALLVNTWANLASSDRRTGNDAVWAMSNDPATAVAMLKVRLRPVRAPTIHEISTLIAGLEAEAFADRVSAQKRIREHGQTIRPQILEAATSNRSAEARQRLNQVLTDWHRSDSFTPDELRASRAVLVLERIGTPAAKDLLREYAAGADAAILTREARKALR